MSAYSRRALIRGWALYNIRINTVSPFLENVLKLLGYGRVFLWFCDFVSFNLTHQQMLFILVKELHILISCGPFPWDLCVNLTYSRLLNCDREGTRRPGGLDKEGLLSQSLSINLSSFTFFVYVKQMPEYNNLINIYWLHFLSRDNEHLSLIKRFPPDACNIRRTTQWVKLITCDLKSI